MFFIDLIISHIVSLNLIQLLGLCLIAIYTLWGINNVAMNFLQQLLQILTNFDNFCIKLTRNE